MATDRPRILHVTECFDGGVSRAIRTIATVCDSYSHDLIYLGQDMASLHGFDTVVRLTSSGHLARMRQLKKAVAEMKPDIVHLHSSWAGLYGRVGRLGARVVYQPHCYKFDDPALPFAFRGIIRLAEKWLSRRSDVNIALTPHEFTLAKQMNPRPDCVVMPNVPSVPRLETKERHAPSSKTVVAMAGRVCKQKDPEFFAEVARLVRELCPSREWHFKWIGAGDDGGERVLRDTGAEITGWCDSKRLAEELDSSDVYIHTASYEGFPIAVLDAAARRMPIVARRIPALEGSGLLLDESPVGMARTVVDVATGEQTLRDALTRSRRLLELMTPEVQREVLLTAYAAELVPA